MESLNLLYRHGNRVPVRNRPETPEPYWLLYRERTGLGSPAKLQQFGSILARIEFARRVDVVAFGQKK